MNTITFGFIWRIQLKHWFILVALIHINPALSQDTTSVTFTQELDTLVNQRFIDRYENVFMTKIPTRNIFKIGYLITGYKGTGINLAYEYKVFPFLSLEALFYTQTNQPGKRLYLDSFNRQFYKETMLIGAKGRWYLNMQKRIKSEVSANNFSGNYLAFSYEQSVSSFSNLQQSIYRNHLGITYGFQSRFLSNGFIDFSLGLYHIKSNSLLYSTAVNDPGTFNVKRILLASHTSIGLAYGDWKKSGKPPLCDILLCDQYFDQQFKIRLPEISIGFNRQSIQAKVGYEKKIGKSPMSVDLSISNSTFRTSLGRYSSLNMVTNAEAQLRYYFLQKRQIRKGKGSNNLSGIYIAPVAYYGYSYEDYGRVYTLNTITAGAIAGYQQRFFKNIYFDAAAGYVEEHSLNPKARKTSYVDVKVEASLGFAF